MPVEPEVTRAVLRQEAPAVVEVGRTYGWEVVVDLAALTVTVTMRAWNTDVYIVESRCDDYKELPPFFEFIDPVTGERGTKRAYPQGHDSFFHNAPCICAPFNRKAYRAVDALGPHNDWSLGDWTRSTASGIPWENYTSLAEMFGLIQTRLSRQEFYKGRQG